jgi:transmembrane sensor
LAAADRVDITSAGALTPEHGVDLAAVTSWTHRQLVFDRRPLGEVAEEFNRYNHDRIDVKSETLRKQQITGMFNADDAASFLSFLASIPGVRIRDVGGGVHEVTLNDNTSAVK